MTKVQTGDRTVDEAGYVRVSRAVHCVLETRSIPASSFASPFPGPRGRKRSVLFLHNAKSTGSGEVLYLGGDRAETTTGYPLQVGETIRLLITPGVLGRVAAFSAASVAKLLHTG